ncbi:unnamed protein product [Symbiodinium sp. CCMP2592]|nr:unnamed protein product [Symbiodinium sp. CCMP2592]
MAKRGGKVGTMVLLLAGLWLGLAGSRLALTLTVASRAGALKRLHAGALKLKAGDVLSRWQLIASSKENTDDLERTTAEAVLSAGLRLVVLPGSCKATAGLDQAEWLQKTAEGIRLFGVDEVRDWAKAVLPRSPQVAETLHEQQVDGEDVLDLTYERLVAEPYKIAAGPAGKLAKRIAAVSAPPTAASGFQAGASADWKGALGSVGAVREDDPDATEFIRELANAKPQDLGVQVFNLTKTLPVEPYDQSGPRLLTRNTTRRAWKAIFELMRNGTKRVAMLGVPGIGKSRNLALGLWHLVRGQLPDGIPQPEAIVFEARQSSTVFLFTKGQDGWKAQRRQMDWSPSGCAHLQNSNNWYLVDASDASKPSQLAAKTVIACSPDRDHYSNFVKDGGECVFVEAFRWAEVKACYPQLETKVDPEDLRQRFQQVGGALRTLLASPMGYEQAVELQMAEAKEFSTVERVFAGELNNVEGKTMPTRLFTYRSADGISKKVTVCSPGAATLLVEKHYDKLVPLWCDPSGKCGCEESPMELQIGPVMDLQVKEGLQLLECDTDHIFDARWREAVQRGSLEGHVLHSPENYPVIDYLLDFNHGISVTTSLKHDIAKAFREKLGEMFGNASQPCSFTLTFLITGEPQKFTPKGSDYEALRGMAGTEKLFDNVRVQVVQIPKKLNSLS